MGNIVCHVMFVVEFRMRGSPVDVQVGGESVARIFQLILFENEFEHFLEKRRRSSYASGSNLHKYRGALR